MPNSRSHTPSQGNPPTQPEHASTQLLGVGTLDTRGEYLITDSNIRFGTDLHTHLARAPKTPDKEMCLLLLHMPEIMKKATIAALRNSASRQAGDHL
ncbi:MAG: hypothetical protein C0436_05390, partial [Alphaproteobacteria bacterium]|nr:hypothetical protein [Alphaproteobacteria bacterium]